MKTIDLEKACELADRVYAAVDQFEEVMKNLLMEFEVIRAERLYEHADKKDEGS